MLGFSFWRWNPNSECALKPYSSNTMYGRSDETESGHLQTVSQIAQFGEEFNFTFLGYDFNIRGIPAKAWYRKYDREYVRLNATDNTTVYVSSTMHTYYYWSHNVASTYNDTTKWRFV